MRLLELFSGTGSIGRAFRDQGFEVTSVDIDPTSNPTICCDILEFDYRQFPPGHFDVVWGSPPCTMYSRARTTARKPRDLEGADALVKRTRDIIDYIKPRFWAFENVGSGLLPGRDVVAGLHCDYVTYCQYASGDFPKYRKLTVVWHNLPWTPRPVCCKASPCEWLVDGRHPVSAQRAPAKAGGVRRPTGQDRCSLATLYSMPPALCDELAEVCWKALRDVVHDHVQGAFEPLDACAPLDLVVLQGSVNGPFHEAEAWEDGDDDDSEGLTGLKRQCSFLHVA